MNDNRDGYIIVMTLIPILVVVGGFTLWHSSGTLPLPSLPSISLPSLPEVQIPVPGFLAATAGFLHDHVIYMLPAAAVGVVVGVFIGGTLIDVGRAARRARGRRKPASPEDDDLLDDVI